MGQKMLSGGGGLKTGATLSILENVILTVMAGDLMCIQKSGESVKNQRVLIQVERFLGSDDVGVSP